MDLQKVVIDYLYSKYTFHPPYVYMYVCMHMILSNHSNTVPVQGAAVLEGLETPGTKGRGFKSRLGQSITENFLSAKQ